MGIVEQAVCCIGEQERHGDDVEIAEGNLVVFLSFLLRLREFVLVVEDNHVGEERKEGIRRRWSNADVYRFGDLPGFQGNAEPLTSQNHPRGVLAVVHQI